MVINDDLSLFAVIALGELCVGQRRAAPLNLLHVFLRDVESPVICIHDEMCNL